MAACASIQEFPSYEGSEASPTKPNPDTLIKQESIDSQPAQSVLTSNREQNSPELKQCIEFCPTNQSKMFFLENQLEKVLLKSDRTLNEAIYVYKNIKNFEFFKNFKEKHKELKTTDALIHLCKVLKLETFFSDNIIYRKDELPDNKVYLVYSGEVVVAPVNINTKPTETAQASASSKKFKTSKSLMRLGSDENIENMRRKARTKTEKMTRLGHNLEYCLPGRKVEILPYSMQNLKEDLSVTKSKVKFDLATNVSAEMSDDNSSEEGSLERRLALENSQQVETIEDQEVKEGSIVCDDMILTEGLQKKKVSRTYNGFPDRSLKMTPIKPAIKKSNSRSDNSLELEATPARKFMKASTINLGAQEFEFEKMVADMSKTPKANSPNPFKLKSFQGIINSITRKSGRFATVLEHNSSGASNPNKTFSQNMNADQEVDMTNVNENFSNYFNSSIRTSNLNSSNGKFRDSEATKFNPNSSLGSIDTKQEESRIEVPGIKKGGTFGQSVLSNTRPREETMVAKTYTKVLTFTVDDYDYITTRFEKTNTTRMNFLLDHIPELEKAIKYENLQGVDTYFEEQIFTLHNPVIREGDKGKFIYILYEGTCKVYKDPVPPQDQSNQDQKSSRTTLETPRRKMEGAPDKILVCLIQPGVFIGEEILINGTRNYQYTVKAASAAIKVLAIRKKVFKRIMPFEVIDGMKSLAKRRKLNNENMLHQKLNIPSTISTQIRSKMNLLKRLNTAAPAQSFIRSFTDIKDDDNGPEKVAEREKMNSSVQPAIKEQFSHPYRKVSQPNLNKPIRSMPVIPDDYEFKSVKKTNELSNILGSVKSVRSKQELSQDRENSLDQSQTVVKTWNISNQPISFGPQKPTLKDHEVMIRKVEDEMAKLKGNYMQFSRAKVLDGIFKSEQASFRKENTGIYTPKNNRSVVGKNLNNSAVSKFPRIDPSEISTIKFDFGKDNERSLRRDLSGSQERPLASRLKDSREPSPRNLKSILKTISPKNSNYLLVGVNNSEGVTNMKSMGFTSMRPPESQEGVSQGRQSRSNLSKTSNSFRSIQPKKTIRIGKSTEKFEEGSRVQIIKRKIVIQDAKSQIELSGVYPEVGVIGKQFP